MNATYALSFEQNPSTVCTDLTLFQVILTGEEKKNLRCCTTVGCPEKTPNQVLCSTDVTILCCQWKSLRIASLLKASFFYPDQQEKRHSRRSAWLNKDSWCSSNAKRKLRWKLFQGVEMRAGYDPAPDQDITSYSSFAYSYICTVSELQFVLGCCKGRIHQSQKD